MDKATCPRRQEMMLRLVLEDRTLPPTEEDLAHAKDCQVCHRALKVAGSLDQKLILAFETARQSAVPVPPGPDLELLLKPSTSPRWFPWLVITGLLVVFGIVVLIWKSVSPAPSVAVPSVPPVGVPHQAPKAPAPACHIIAGAFLDEDGASVPPLTEIRGKRLSISASGKMAHRRDATLLVSNASFTVLEGGIALQSGTLEAHIPTRGTQFSVHTRMARISVTGTKFRVAFPEADRLEVACSEGRVGVETIAGERFGLGVGEEVTLTAHGFRVPPGSSSASGTTFVSTSPDTASGSPVAGASTSTGIDEEFSPDLRLAIKKESLERVRELVSQLSQVNVRDQRSWTPLHEAAYRGRTEVIELLFSRGADPNVQTEDGWPPLSEAAYMGNAAAARLLLDRGARVDVVDGLGWTPLFRAAQGNQPALMKLLLERGASVSASDRQGAAVLHRCAAGNQMEPAQVVLAAGADPNGLDRDECTPLHIAARSGANSVAILLLSSKAFPNARNRLGNTPLHESAMKGLASMVQLLASSGADLEPRNTAGFTPLALALQNNEEETATLLRNLGATLH